MAILAEKYVPLPTQESSLRVRQEYPNKPIIIGEAKSVIESGTIIWDETNTAIVRLPSGEKMNVPPTNQNDHVESTMRTLLGNVQPGSEWEDRINKAYNDYTEAKIKDPVKLLYGNIVYHPLINHLVWLAPKELKSLALLARNEALIQDSEQKLSYREIREILGNLVIGVIGASVASNAAHRIIDTLRPKWIKLADYDEFDDAVRGRRRFGVLDTLQNKATVTAREINETDPWLPVSVYDEGINEDNSSEFMDGNQKELRVNHLVEAVDSLEMKYSIAEQARKYKIPLWRISDIGVAWQVEYLPFHIYPQFPLSISTNDNDLYNSLQNALDRPNRDHFFEFASKLIGNNHKLVQEFNDFIRGKIKTPFGTAIPQLGIAAEGVASHLALSLASVELGWQCPNRMFVDLRSGTLIKEYLKPVFGRWILIREMTDQSTGISTKEIIDQELGTMLERTMVNLPSHEIIREITDINSGKTIRTENDLYTGKIVKHEEITPEKRALDNARVQLINTIMTHYK